MKTIVPSKKFHDGPCFLAKKSRIRSIILLFLLLIPVQLGKAQGIQFGIFVDPQVTWMSSDNNEITSNGSRIGFNFGLTLHNFFTENYAFTTGISLNYIGGKLRHSDSTFFRIQEEVDTLLPGTTITYKLQYLNFPIGLTLKTNEIGYITYFAQLGFDVQVKLKAVGDKSNGFEDERINEEVNWFNLGYHFGIGMEYSLGGNTSIVLGLSFSQSLIDVTKDFANQPEDRIVLNNIVLRVGVNF
jgi:opacity protein-like surface antigen